MTPDRQKSKNHLKVKNLHVEKIQGDFVEFCKLEKVWLCCVEFLCRWLSFIKNVHVICSRKTKLKLLILLE